MVKTMGNGDFDFKTWAVKGAKKVGMAIGITACDATFNYFTETSNEIPAQYVLAVTIVMVVIQQIGNYLKHK